MVDSIDVHELMKEFVLLRGSQTLRSDRFSFEKLFMYDATGFFYNVSGYCFLILKFPVVPRRHQKVGVQKKFSCKRSEQDVPPTFKNVAPPLKVAI